MIQILITAQSDALRDISTIYRTEENIVDQKLPSKDWKGRSGGNEKKPRKIIREFPRPEQCTENQLLKINKQLDPTACVRRRKNPFRQFCSITQATKCVEPSWLDEYYAEIYHSNNDGDYDQYAIPLHHRRNSPPFLALSVGCNKGFDALNTLRMGTYDPLFDKKQWRNAMESDGTHLHHSVCAQNKSPQFQLPPPLNRTKTSTGIVKKFQRPGEMHCFEPMPTTVEKLRSSVQELKLEERGFRVIHAAVSVNAGIGKFPKPQEGVAAGIENNGLGNCDAITLKQQQELCQDVEVASLSKYVRDKIDSKFSGPPRVIHSLSIDVEGFDVDVILGAGSEVLKRVEYLEFEYNWMGSWSKQHLYDVVTMLDGKDHRTIFHQDNSTRVDSGLAFTCYWAGDKQLWRISDCWMKYYDIHTWGNVACVNRKLAPQLAEKMEDVFLKTISKEGVIFKHRNDRKNRTRQSPLEQTEPISELISTEYID